MVIFHKYLRESTEPVKHDLIASQARCTCSMQGEKEHRTPSCFSIKLTDGTASQGWGKSRKTASAAARCSSGNPSPCISLTLTVIRLLRPFLSKSSLLSMIRAHRPIWTTLYTTTATADSGFHIHSFKVTVV